jgi:hypothetical protein
MSQGRLSGILPLPHTMPVTYSSLVRFRVKPISIEGNVRKQSQKANGDTTNRPELFFALFLALLLALQRLIRSSHSYNLLLP